MVASAKSKNTLHVLFRYKLEWFVALAWGALFLSLGAPNPPAFDTKFLSLVNLFRWLVPLSILPICILWMSIASHWKKTQNWARLFFIYFLIVAVSTFNRETDFATIYYPVAGLSALALICVGEGVTPDPERRFYIFMVPTILFLFVMFALFLSLDIQQTAVTNSFNGYESGSRSEQQVLGAAKPNPNGISRTIILLMFVLVFLDLRYLSENAKKIMLGLLLSCVAFYQSRGAVLAGLIALAYLQLSGFKRFSFQLKEAISICLSAAFGYLTLLFFVLLVHDSHSSLSLASFQMDSNRKMFRTFWSEDISSGRLTDWWSAFLLIKDKPFLGWGSQADRIYIGETVSNLPIYATLCGGVIALGTLMILGLLTLKTLLAKQNRHDQLRADEVFCVAIIIFLAIRGCVEVGFSVFGIDQLLMFICLSIFYQPNNSVYYKPST